MQHVHPFIQSFIEARQHYLLIFFRLCHVIRLCLVLFYLMGDTFCEPYFVCFQVGSDVVIVRRATTAGGEPMSFQCSPTV